MTDRASAISTEGLHPECAKRGYHRDGCRAMTDRASAEGLHKVLVTEELFRELGASRVDWGEPDADGFYTPMLYSNTGPRPDSGIDDRERELRKRLTQHHRDQHLTAGTCPSCLAVLGRLSTPRTETSEP